MSGHGATIGRACRTSSSQMVSSSGKCQSSTRWLKPIFFFTILNPCFFFKYCELCVISVPVLVRGHHFLVGHLRWYAVDVSKRHSSDLHFQRLKDFVAFLRYRFSYIFNFFKLSFKCIAAGLLLPGANGLKDPVEKETINVLDCLELQESEDVTASSQHALRLMAYRRIYKVRLIKK